MHSQTAGISRVFCQPDCQNAGITRIFCEPCGQKCWKLWIFHDIHSQKAGASFLCEFYLNMLEFLGCELDGQK